MYFSWSISNVVESTCFIHSFVHSIFFLLSFIPLSFHIENFYYCKLQITMLIFSLFLSRSLFFCFRTIFAISFVTFLYVVRMYVQHICSATLAGRFFTSFFLLAAWFFLLMQCAKWRCSNVDYFKLSIKRTIQFIMYWNKSIFCDF